MKGVKIERSTGYGFVDGPIVTSLYKMTAEGDYEGDLVLNLEVVINGWREGSDEEEKKNGVEKEGERGGEGDEEG